MSEACKISDANLKEPFVIKRGYKNFIVESVCWKY